MKHPVSATRSLHIAAAIIVDDTGRLLLVRKRGTQAFMQAGGKIEPGESAAAALRRELYEELSQRPARLAYLGEYQAPAANEPGLHVRAQLFRVDIAGGVTPAAEIAEVRWVTPHQALGLALAPLTRHKVLPWVVTNASQVSQADIEISPLSGAD
ncbi:ADP-ribose pyrophosphatase YjhB, NUDIX family [Franzmannia pantelleriensis]|uniref:ADP-ribose pyrophosphatase YjhB, NUDIX family n=1 Tax=Franzmannia pantelleriensis TaxID=48727 RepID=A0A1G9RWW6_9GAMM|nr:NUDIX domain-containing protein [Halomonas pantelleriensis]SDM27510.1 ADP-ribose pyrophosphatase YjhB, NUDIX family [Halomonas pantelleriensis]